MEFLKKPDFDLINDMLTKGKDVKIRRTGRGVVILEITPKTVRKIEVPADEE